jgi:nucleoid-associated protein YgaU
MGLFSFLKNAGAKIFGSKRRETATVTTPEAPKAEPSKADVEAAMARDLESLVRGLGLGVDNLNVDFNSDIDTATIYGTVDTVEEQEKVILAVGNVDGVASVDERIQVRAEGTTTRSVLPEQNTASRFYTVKKGDTLWKIATEMYGDGTKHASIFEANRPMLKSPDAIYPDQVLRIPNA